MGKKRDRQTNWLTFLFCCVKKYGQIHLRDLQRRAPVNDVNDARVLFSKTKKRKALPSMKDPLELTSFHASNLT